MNRKQLFQTITMHTLAKGIRLFAVAALMAGFVAAVRPARAACAAKLTVTAGAPDVMANDGSCSLREAIANANNNATTWADCVPSGTYGADTITLPAGIYTFGYIGAGEDANFTGDFDILASGGDLTINGTGTAIINGGGADRVLHVCPGGACGITVILDHVIIENGHAGAGAGGGIHNSGTLIVQNGSIIGWSSGGNTTLGNGGGIYNAGAVTVDASIVSNNFANNGGGGIYNSGALTVTNGSVIGGASANIASSIGGGIFNSGGGTAVVDGSTISNNTAPYGGGIFNSGTGTTLIVQNGSTIGGAGAGNTATNSGGGIDVAGGTVIVDGSTVSANTADSGGGIYKRGSGTLVVQNGSTIGGVGAGNTALTGGGIYSDGGTMTVDGSIVSANTANAGPTADAGKGGGIYIDTIPSVLTVITNSSTIGGAGVGNTAASAGGGIYVGGGTAIVDGSTVSANTATSGGGISNLAALTVTNGSTIGGVGVGNTATGSGGGIYNYGGTTTVDGSTVSANTAQNNGGGIYNEDHPLSISTLVVQNGSTIGGTGAGNTATDYWGGGIYNESAATVDGSTVSANTATDGGGIYNADTGTLTVTNSSVIGGVGASNTASDEGGGIYNYGGTTIVDGSTVSANTANNNGGGIYNSGTLTVQNGSTIGGAGASNTAVNYGGGIFNWIGGTTVVDGSTVSANAANNCGGIFSSATLTVQNGSTIGGVGAGNTAYSDDGGICQSGIGGTTTVVGSRILYNTASGDGGGVGNHRDVYGAVSVTGSCIVGNSVSSFANTQTALQTATGNWWGAATGPNTPDADTTSGDVDTSGFLTTPILACPSGGSSEMVYLPLVLRED